MMTTKARVLLWDIESSNLDADFGIMLCFGYKLLGGQQAEVLSIKDFPTYRKSVTDDKLLVKAASEVLSAADVWVTWYGKRFDVPFVNSRRIAHHLPPLPPMPHVDGWETSRSRLRIHSNRLMSVSAFLEIEEKTPLKPAIWVKALAGHRPSLRYIEEHCRQDVEVLESAYQRLKPLMDTHPHVGLLVSGKKDGCPKCGAPRLTARGYLVAQMRRYQRLQCQACGGWTKRVVT